MTVPAPISSSSASTTPVARSPVTRIRLTSHSVRTSPPAASNERRMARTMLPIPPSGSPVEPRRTCRRGSCSAETFDDASDIGRIISQVAEPGDSGLTQFDMTPSIASIDLMCSDSRYSPSRSATLPRNTLANASSSSGVSRREASARSVGGASNNEAPRRSASRFKKSNSAA